jgi:hypothetical protein
VSENSPPASLKAQRSQREKYFSFAVERTAKEKHSASLYYNALLLVVNNIIEGILIFAFLPLSGKQKI